MDDITTNVMGKLLTLCKSIDIAFDGLDGGQKIGIMMDTYTKSVIFQYVEEELNFPKNKLMSTISTENHHHCPIIIDDNMPLFELKACLVQQLDI